MEPSNKANALIYIKYFDLYHLIVLIYLTVLVYTKKIIHLSVGGLWWVFTSPLRGLGTTTFTSVNN